MSIAALNYVKTRWDGLLPSDKLVLSSIAERTEKSRGCWPSRRTLAKDTGLSIDTIKRSLKRLVAKQLIHRSSRYDDNGCRAASLIKIVGFSDTATVGAACTQGWVQESPQGGCADAPRVGAASPLSYKEEPKIEPKEEPKGKIRVADAHGPTLDHPPPINSSLDPLEAFNSYNQTAEQIGLPIARSLPPGRRKSINARLREHGAESWSTVLANVRASDFLQGRNDRGWRPNLDWIIKPENYAKILEGTYAGNTRLEKPDRSNMVFKPSRWGPGKWVPRAAETVQ